MKTTLLLLAILMTVLAFGQTQPVSREANAKAEQEIMALEDSYVALTQKSDFKTLAELIDKTLTDRCTTVHGDGRVEDRTSALKGLRSMIDQKDPNLLTETYQYVDRQVDVYGDAAVLTARAIWRTQGQVKAGKAPIEARFTHFFVKQDGQWKVAKIHITNLPTN